MTVVNVHTCTSGRRETRDAITRALEDWQQFVQ